MATLGIYWLVRLLGNQPAAAWREELRERPERIAWVYSLVTERMPFGLNLMRFRYALPSGKGRYRTRL